MAELEAQDISYRPITFSCFGRPRPDSFKVVQALAKRAARRHGGETHIEERRLMARIRHEIWRQAARMVLQCWPVVETEDDGEDIAVDSAAEARIEHPSSVELCPLAG